MEFLTLDDVEVGGKTVFVRPDLNCPVDNGKPELSPRMVAHAKTIRELCQKGAKVVVLAHQGRPGKDDFISLRHHAPLLRIQLGAAIPVSFVPDVCGPQAQAAIKSLSAGHVLLLENTRFIESETGYEKTRRSEIVDRLLPLCDVFVLDAFSVAHRAHASVVGFSACPRSVAGRVMQTELEALSKFEEPARPVVLAMGGAKPADSLPIMAQWLADGKADSVLCGGAMGNLMLIAAGRTLGAPSEAFLSGSGSLADLDKLRTFYAKHSAKLLIPSDVVVQTGDSPEHLDVSELPSKSPILDIGPKTASAFAARLASAGSIVLNGPMGVYEKDDFSNGTRTVLSAAAQSAGFSLLGGGHTISAIARFGMRESDFGYVSLSGKALIEYLSGEKLPGVEMLQAASGR